MASAGLAGALGVFHHGRGNKWALVDDLMEPFRPMVDQIVFTATANGEPLGSPQKTLISQHLTNPFDSSGKSLTTVFNDFSQQYGLYIEGNINHLKVPVWEGKLDAGER